MGNQRRIRQVLVAKSVLEGAGVQLKRAFGFHELPLFDPFLLLDDFRSTTPEHYLKGFPWHPHRGIETITYVLRGKVEHGDTLGNSGTIYAGDVQWMSAGSGIIHQEMPKGDEEGRLEGFQLWANLPAAHKLMAPRYREVLATTIPKLIMEDGVEIKVICGRLGEVEGPVREIVTAPEYLDIMIPPHTQFRHETLAGHTVFAYVVSGLGRFDPSSLVGESEGAYGRETVILYEDGGYVLVRTEEEGVRFLLIAGQPLHEPIAWRGPIVMNTEEELELAFAQYHNHTFVTGGHDDHE